MDPTWQGIFFLVAVILFVVAGLGSWRGGAINFVAFGLAFFSFVFMWQAFAAT